MQPVITPFFDQNTHTATYVVRDPSSDRCAVIDPVLDFDPVSGRSGTEHADSVIEFITANDLTLEWILETHVHADHLTAAPHIKTALGGRVGIGAHIRTVQDVFSAIFNISDVDADGGQFDQLFVDADEFFVGSLKGQVIHTPGHTPACNTYVIGDAAFVGDTLFMPDSGTARCDFPGGDAAQLYQSIQKIFELPPETRLFMCHDYKSPQRDEYAWETTVAEQRKNNVHVHDGIIERQFVQMRNERDVSLGLPKLIIPSIQVNIRGGKFPPPEQNGTSYLKIPLNKF